MWLRRETPYLRWYLYQGLRLAFIWSALAILAAAFGLETAIVSAILFGLSIKYDYWSNAVEFLAGCLVAGHWLRWDVGLLVGAVLGLGRETIPFLALAGGWPIALGASVSTYGLRFFTHRDPQWDQIEKDCEYGKSQWRTNLALLRGQNPAAYLDIAVYVGIAGLAAVSAPWLALALVGTTLLIARIDEPRVLTMLIPFAALTVTQWL